MIDSQTYFWVFSTIIQAFAALVALIGMFIVFRLQSIKNELNSSYRDLAGFYNSTLPRDRLVKQVDKDIERYKEEIKKRQDELKTNPVDLRKKQLEDEIKRFENSKTECENRIDIIFSYYEEQRDIVKETKPIFISNGSLISLSIIVLPLQNLFGNYSQIIVIGVGTISALVVLISTFQHLWKIIGHSVHDF